MESIKMSNHLKYVAENAIKVHSNPTKIMATAF